MINCPACGTELVVELRKKDGGVVPGDKVRVFVGAYDLLGAEGDYRNFLLRVKGSGACGVRLFVCYSWNGPQLLSPYVQDGWWTHDKGIVFPNYRLGTPEDPMWSRLSWENLRLVLEEMKRLGLTAWLVAEDFCSLKGDSRQKYWNPFYSSRESLGPNTPGGVWGDAMKQYHEALFQKVIETANATGVDYLMEAMNEADVVDGTREDVINWNIWSAFSINRLGFPKAKIIASTGRGIGELVSHIGYHSPHGIGKADQIDIPLYFPPSRTIWSSDGVWGGDGHADAKGRRGVGIGDAQKIGARIREIGGAGFELLPRELYKYNNDRANLDYFDPSVVAILVGG